MDRIINTLIDLWLYDVEVMSNPWMYYPLFIPALVYVPFMFFKWVFLTCPVWLPLHLILAAVTSKKQ